MDGALLKMDQVLNNIRGRRCALLLTQYDMADRLSMTQHGYSKIENGLSQLSIERFIQIADTLEISIGELIG